MPGSDQTQENTLIFLLMQWIRTSILCWDTEKWRRGLQKELDEIPQFAEEIRVLNLKIRLSLQSMLMEEGFSYDEIYELLEYPETALQLIEDNGGVYQWKKDRRQFSQV